MKGSYRAPSQAEILATVDQYVALIAQARARGEQPWGLVTLLTEWLALSAKV